MLLNKIKNKKIENLIYRKKTIKLSFFDILIESASWMPLLHNLFKTLILLPVVLCALHEFNNNLKVAIIVI